MFWWNNKLICYKTIHLYALHVLLSEIYYNRVNLNTGRYANYWMTNYVPLIFMHVC